MPSRANIERWRLHALLDKALDLLDQHTPADGAASSPGKDLAMRSVLEHADYLLAVFQPAVDHVFHRELASIEDDPDAHKWEMDVFPFEPKPEDPEKIAAYRTAIASALNLTPSALPQKVSMMLVWSLLAANSGDTPFLFVPHPQKKTGKGSRPALSRHFSDQMRFHVHFRAGLLNETLTASRLHYATLVGVDPRSLETWDVRERPSLTSAAYQLGVDRRTGRNDPDNPLANWKPQTDRAFKAAYSSLIQNRRTTSS